MTDAENQVDLEANAAGSVYCEFKAGVEVVSKEIVDHTFVQSKDLKFGCYGGYNTFDKTPIQSVKGDQVLAKIIACFDPDDSITVLDRKKGNKEFPLNGDCSGLIYGVQGVCHQMANRILFSCIGHPVLNEKISMGEVTKFAYGYYGDFGITPKSESQAGFISWLEYYTLCREKWIAYKSRRKFNSNFMQTEDFTVALNSVKKEMIEFLDTCKNEQYKKIMQYELEHASKENPAIGRLEIMMKQNMGKDFENSKYERLADIAIDAGFGYDPNSKRIEIGREMLVSLLGYDEYNYFNKRFATFSEEFVEMLGQDSFKKVFKENYSPELKLVNNISN